MILSDRDLRAELESGRLVIEPLGRNAIQPSSIDLHVGRHFRIFANTRYPYIDVRKPMEDLTELVEASDGEPFILHPGEFVLGTTTERVAIPNHLVGRLEGKSSLGRLGLLIHSSLPGSEEVLLLDEKGKLAWTPIGQVVRKSLTGAVVAFDPITLEVGYHRITGWYEGPPDVVFEVCLASGRRVRVTAGHNLFTIDRRGDLRRIRTTELRAGTVVAVPRLLPDPAASIPSIDHANRSRLPLLASVRSSELASTETHNHPRFGFQDVPRATGGLSWDPVVKVVHHDAEPTFDLSVRPNGAKIENFLAGRGGVFVANTAGYVDPGFRGHLTLELSNVANLPITIYPGMKIGQISLFRMSSPAENPYGSGSLGSKYLDQVGPTPSRYWENFEEDSSSE